MLRIKQIWKDKKKLSDYIDELKPKKIGLPFGHGLGDEILFMNPFEALCKKYPDIQFTLITQKGLGFEELIDSFDYPNGKAIVSSDLSYKDDTDEYDIIADIDFPMSEGQTEYTKGEWCCLKELGIDPVSGHKKIKSFPNRFIAIHYFITCLPDAANVPYDVAKKVWQEVKDAGYIPIEILMEHVFHNPVNKKYDFIDRHLRDIQPKISTLTGVIQNCAAVICGVSGVFHTAMSLLPPDKVCLLEKDLKAPHFTKLPIKRIDIKNYKDGIIKEWLLQIASK